MRRRDTIVRGATAALLLALTQLTCGGGVPVRLRIDEFTMEISLDDMVNEALAEFQASGLIPQGTQHLPELWPENLPQVLYKALIAAPPISVDLSPEPGTPEAKKYDAISAAEGAINRIEINRLVLRIETSTVSIPLPELRLQIAPEADADPDDRLAWRTIGDIPSAQPGFIGDIDMEYIPSGESFLNSQLTEKEKEFSIRVLGKVEIDTEEYPRVPAGVAQVRLIVVATFFVDPAGAIEAADSI